MKVLGMDLETFSGRDLTKCGVYRYCESPDFEILLFGWSVDGGEAKVIDLAQGEEIPEEILRALTDDNVVKRSYNASFERVCLSRYLRDRGLIEGFLSPEGWQCTMVWAAALGLPMSLKGVGAVLNLDSQKMDEGKSLIKYFSMPDSEGKRHLPSSAPDKWRIFKEYNKRDVEVETAIAKRLNNFSLPEFVWNEYHLSEEINDRGILVDMTLVDRAIEMDEKSREELTGEMKKLTYLDNPNSVAQMKRWFSENGLQMESLGKKDVSEAIKTAPPELKEVLRLRRQLAKSSVKKYQAMKNAACEDGRCRGMYRFYGANRTGRFASRIIQLQNLPQNHLADLESARELVKSGNYEAVEMLYGDVPDTLSQLIRTAFIPKPGTEFYVADFSAIEARVIAWFAGETWKSEAFADGEDIYCSTASRMFGVPVVKHGVNGELRAKGKVAELACGYGGSVGALKAMGALDMGLDEEELPGIVSSWRDANRQIVKFWYDVGRCVTQAVRDHKASSLGRLRFFWRAGALFIILPSGRNLVYVRPAIGVNRFGSECVTYEGIGRNRKWERIESYGPKFVENIVQGTARDILLNSMKTLSNRSIVGHVHDELIIECGPETSLEEICSLMAKTPDWAERLVLRADGYKCGFYRKD